MPSKDWNYFDKYAGKAIWLGQVEITNLSERCDLSISILGFCLSTLQLRLQGPKLLFSLLQLPRCLASVSLCR